MSARAWMALLAGSAWCAAAPAAEPVREIEFGVFGETTDGPAPDAHEVDLTLRLPLAGGVQAALGARSVRRYDRTDNELAVGASAPFGDGWTLGARLAASPGADVIARGRLTLDAARALGGGWVAAGALDRSVYAASGVSSLRLGLERYVGDWRLAGSVVGTRLDGGQGDSGVQFALDRYVGDKGRIGLLYAQGTELEAVPGGTLSSEVRALALIGRWPLDASWSIVGALSTTSVTDRRRESGAAAGSDERRTAARIGVQHGF